MALPTPEAFLASLTPLSPRTAATIQTDADCPICHRAFNHPIPVPSCGHIFCRACIANYISTTGARTCPFCGGEILLDPNSDEGLGIWDPNLPGGDIDLTYWEGEAESFGVRARRKMHVRDAMEDRGMRTLLARGRQGSDRFWVSPAGVGVVLRDFAPVLEQAREAFEIGPRRPRERKLLVVRSEAVRMPMVAAAQILAGVVFESPSFEREREGSWRMSGEGRAVWWGIVGRLWLSLGRMEGLVVDDGNFEWWMVTKMLEGFDEGNVQVRVPTEMLALRLMVVMRDATDAVVASRMNRGILGWFRRREEYEEEYERVRIANQGDSG